ncbi:hypothetical protein COOONC_14198, partial [Cooperia oncophora]
FPLGFAMDNVTLVRNLGHRIQMRIVPDPEFAPFKGTDLTTLLEFIHRLLWEDNGWTHSPSLYASTLPVTLAQFDALLSCKQFVFSIVETAESESGMSLSEKSMLSSLLIAVLLRNFQYCTDVVLSLLRAHIAKSV